MYLCIWYDILIVYIFRDTDGTAPHVNCDSSLAEYFAVDFAGGGAVHLLGECLCEVLDGQLFFSVCEC